MAMTTKQDKAYDKKNGIKEGSPKDKKLDKVKAKGKGKK